MTVDTDDNGGGWCARDVTDGCAWSDTGAVSLGGVDVTTD